MLIVFTVGAWIGGKLLIRPYDPWVAWMHLSEIKGAWREFPIAFVLLLLIIIGSVIISRVFCRYLCPMGAFLSLLNKISPFQVYRDLKNIINPSFHTTKLREAVARILEKRK